jgi:hypothetical protein
MTDEKDILTNAIDDLKAQGLSAAPPQEVVNETLTRLARAEAAHDALGPHETQAAFGSSTRLRMRSAARWAVAAAVLLTAGYAIGRISATTEPNIEQLHAALLPSLAASLEPAIRQRVLEETTRGYQQAMVTGYVRLKEELTEQRRADLDRLAVQLFTASNSVTNELLTQLVEAVESSQQQDRRWITTALENIEAKRAAENSELGTALVRLAARTQTEIQRTNDIVRSLANTQPETTKPNENQADAVN